MQSWCGVTEVCDLPSASAACPLCQVPVDRVPVPLCLSSYSDYTLPHLRANVFSRSRLIIRNVLLLLLFFLNTPGSKDPRG